VIVGDEEEQAGEASVSFCARNARSFACRRNALADAISDLLFGTGERNEPRTISKTGTARRLKAWWKENGRRDSPRGTLVLAAIAAWNGWMWVSTLAVRAGRRAVRHAA